MNFFRGFSINVICMGLAFALGFANQVLIARGLGEEGRGHLALVATTVMFATLLLGEWLNRGNTFVTSKEGTEQPGAEQYVPLRGWGSPSF